MKTMLLLISALTAALGLPSSTDPGRPPPLQKISLDLEVVVGWVYIYQTGQNISIAGGKGFLSIDPEFRSVTANAQGLPGHTPQTIRLVNGTRYFINVLAEGGDPSKAKPHNHTYPAGQRIIDPSDQDFCDWINPRPCSWDMVEAYWSAFERVGAGVVHGEPCNDFGQSYSYGSGPFAVNRTVQLCFYKNGSLARLDHTEHRTWGITHSIDLSRIYSQTLQ